MDLFEQESYQWYDGIQERWVAPPLIRAGHCDECNTPAHDLLPATDMSGLEGAVCLSCNANPGWGYSFA